MGFKQMLQICSSLCLREKEILTIFLNPRYLNPLKQSICLELQHFIRKGLW